jgi:putative nucleotidyltransferase with HDIG domain
MTGYPTVQTAISVLQMGGYDYLIKPFKLEDLKSTIMRGLEHQRLKRENVKLRSQLELIKIFDAVNHGLKLNVLLNLVTQTAMRELAAEGVSIILLDRKAKKYRLRSRAVDSCRGEAERFLSGEGRYGVDRADRETPFVHCEKFKIKNVEHCRNYISFPLMAKGCNIGFLNLVCLTRFKAIDPGQEHLLSFLASTVAASVENNYMDRTIKKSYLLTIKALANAVEARDHYTAGHTDRVYRVARVVARRLGWSPAQISNLRTGSILHDIGKIGVPDAILNKPDQLTAEEFAIMKKHPETGLQILRGIPFLESVLPYVISHHERFDGAGYPFGLKGEQIPIEGRLLAVIDTFDAIMSDRPYRKSADAAKALDELKTYKGSQFDPVIVDAFLAAFEAGEINYKPIYERRFDKHPVATYQLKREPV